MKLRVLMAHNAYLHRGGEEVVVDNESQALREAGVEVQTFIPRNTAGWSTAAAALQAPLGGGEESRLEELIASEKPEILHTHNLYPLLSPRIFAQAKRKGVKTVLSFHNFRPLCLNGLFLTPKKEVCERCAGGNFLHGIARGCYRGSRVQSLGMASHLTAARTAGWYDAADAYIASSHFLKDKFVASGMPASKFTVQGNFLADFPSYEFIPPEPYVMFLGRLSEEKGVLWLLETFARPALPLRLIVGGTGPLAARVKAAPGTAVDSLGFVSEEEKDRRLRRATALIMSSECYENYPIAVIEANARGIPAVVVGHGGMAEMVAPGKNGEHYALRDTVSFWNAIEKIRTSPDPKALRQNVRSHAEKHFSKTGFIEKRLPLYKALAAS